MTEEHFVEKGLLAACGEVCDNTLMCSARRLVWRQLKGFCMKAGERLLHLFSYGIHADSVGQHYLSVCPQCNEKQMIPKFSNLGYTRSDMDMRLKGRRSRSHTCFFTLIVGAYLKNEWSQSVQIWYREWPWDILEVTWFWGWKVKGQG